MNHLNQMEIQDYLDGNLLERESDLELHLAECSRCRAEVEQYQVLFADLVNLEPPRPPHDFAAKVMEQLPGRQPASLTERLWRVVPIAAAALVALVASIIWIDWSWLNEVLPKTNLATFQQELDTSLAQLQGALPLDRTLLLIAAGVVLLLFYLDRLMRQARQRTLQVW